MKFCQRKAFLVVFLGATLLPEYCLAQDAGSISSSPSSSHNLKSVRKLAASTPSPSASEMLSPPPKSVDAPSATGKSADASKPKSLETLSATAQEVARDIGISQYIVELEAMKANTPNPDAVKRDVQFLFIKQEMTETLLTTFLETRDIVAAVDDEMSRSSELKDLLESRRDRAIRLNNITNFTSGGALAMIGSGIQIGGGLAIGNAGNIMEVAAGGLSTGISTYALKQSSGEKRSAGANPNMLAVIFDIPSIKDKEIPTPIRNFLNEPIPGGKGESRRDLLIGRWVQLGRIPPPTSKAGQRRVALLAGAIPQRHEVTIDLLDDRVAMLNDMRAVVSSMTRELLQIMRVMRKL